MRLLSIRLHAFSLAYPGVVDVPMREVPEGIVVLVARNGGGKTALLDAVSAALYGELTSRPIIPVDFAIARDAYIHLEYELGVEVLRSIYTMDAQSRSTSALLMRLVDDGAPEKLNDGKTTTYKKAILDRFPSFELWQNTVFAGQGRGDKFTSAKPSARKDIFIEMLALKRLLTMQKAAGEAQKLALAALGRLQAQIDALEQEVTPAAFAALDRWLEETDLNEAKTRLRLSDLEYIIGRLDAKAALAGNANEAFAAAELQKLTFEGELTRRQQELERARRQRLAQQDKRTFEAQAITLRRDTTVRDLDGRIAANEGLLQNESNIRAAAAAVAPMTAALEQLRAEAQQLCDDRQRLSSVLAAAKAAVHAFTKPKHDLDRAKTDSQLLDTVPCHGDEAYRSCQFLVNAAAAASRIPALEEQLQGLIAAVEHEASLQGQLPAIDAVLATVRTSIAEAERILADHTKTAQELPHLEVAKTKLEERRTQRSAAIATAERELAELRDRFEAADAADQRREDELAADVARLQGEYNTALTALTQLQAGKSQATQLEQELALARNEEATLQMRLGEFAGNRAEITRLRGVLEVKQAQHAELMRRINHVRQEAVEWGALASSIGKGGLADHEIDAAGPEITAICNQLLLACYGARFSVEIVTQVEKVDGGMKDEFTVRVFDNEAHGGWRDDIGELSGGQKVVVQEALMCAIALFVNQRSSRPLRTLFRDETGAALDPDNAVAYMAMLRKVRELGQFHHVLVVTHNAAAAALADTQLRIADGQVRVVAPPFSQEAA